MLVAILVAALPAVGPVLVLDPTADDLPPDTLPLLGARVADALADRGVESVIGQSELRSLVDAEVRRQSVGCDDAACASEIAEALGAERVIVSRVVRIGEMYTWHFTALDVKGGRVLERVEAQGANVDALMSNARPALDVLASSLGASAKLHRVLWPASCVGVALAIAASGAAFDVLSYTSRNETLDAADAIAPAAYVTAGAIAVASFFNPFERE
jgi:hypothetical protein